MRPYGHSPCPVLSTGMAVFDFDAHPRPLRAVFGRNVAAYRTLGQMTQTDLAERMTILGLPTERSKLAYWETARNSGWLDSVAVVAAALGTSVAALLDSRGPLRSPGPPLELLNGAVLPPALAAAFTTEPYLSPAAVDALRRLCDAESRRAADR